MQGDSRSEPHDAIFVFQGLLVCACVSTPVCECEGRALPGDNALTVPCIRASSSQIRTTVFLIDAVLQRLCVCVCCHHTMFECVCARVSVNPIANTVVSQWLCLRGEKYPLT